MKKATGRRADYLSHQNKLAEVQLEETSAKLDKQLITKSAAYQHERRQLAQELRDFAREKNRMIPRSQSPPPNFKINFSGTTGAIRKYSVPSKIQSNHRYLDIPSHDTGGGEHISGRPRAKSRSLVDLNELENLEGGNVDDSVISYDLIPQMKRSSESVSRSWENGRKHSLQGMHTLRPSPKPSTNHLPPIPTETRNRALRSLRGDSLDRRKGELLLDVPRYPPDNESVTGQRQQGLHLRPLKNRDRTGNASGELERSVKTPTSPQTPSESGKANLVKSQDRGEVKQNTAYKVTEKLSEHRPKQSPSSPRIRKHLEAERLKTHTEIKDNIGQDILQSHPVRCVIINSEADEKEALEGVKSSILPSQPQRESYDQADNNCDETASNAESVYKDSHQRRHSRKISTGSQQIHLSTHAPSQECLQRAVRKVSTDSAPLINIAAAIHGKTRKAGTGLAPNLTNVFLDSTAYQSGDSGDGNTGLALDSESVTVSNDSSPGRRLSHGVPMNAAERSRERGSLALRGNRVRQEDPSTADLIRYYQDVPEAAALAGISVEPLDLSELESCRYLRKYVPKSLREDDSLVE